MITWTTQKEIFHYHYTCNEYVNHSCSSVFTDNCTDMCADLIIILLCVEFDRYPTMAPVAHCTDQKREGTGGAVSVYIQGHHGPKAANRRGGQ